MFIAKWWGTRLLQSLMLLLFFALGNFGVLHAQELKPQANPKALLDQIWKPTPLKPLLNKQDQKYAQSSLAHWLETYLRFEYEVVDQRFHWGDSKRLGWIGVGKGHASHIGKESKWEGATVQQDWGPDVAWLWRVQIDGEARYFAVAMSNDPVPGTRGHYLIGRFELKKID
jgi:hypothetical protein